MPTALQEFSSDSITSESCHGFSIAIHRRLASILFFSSDIDGDGGEFQVLQCQNGESWCKSGGWKLPESHRNSIIIKGLPVEAFDAFLVVLSTNNETSVLFLGATNCSFVSISEVPSTVQPICADIDQFRKELLLGFTRGLLISFAIRQLGGMNASLSKQEGMKVENKTGLQNHKVIQAISRKQVRIQHVLGNDIPENFSIYQVANGEINGTSFVLSSEGCICCLETSTLTSLWIVQSTFLKYVPIYIWVDHFGSDFIVLCSNKTNKRGDSTRGVVEMGDDIDIDCSDEIHILEYWIPPDNSTDAKAGLFKRSKLPVTGKITALTIETVHPDFGTFIAVVVDNCRMNLFVKCEKKETITLESTIILKNIFKRNNKIQNQQSIKSTNKNKSTDKIFNENECAVNGASAFILSTPLIPDCPVIFLFAQNSEIKSIALHVPTFSDILHMRKCLFVSASQLEISAMAKPSKQKNEYENFLVKSNTQNSKLDTAFFRGKNFVEDLNSPFLEILADERDDKGFFREKLKGLSNAEKYDEVEIASNFDGKKEFEKITDDLKEAVVEKFIDKIDFSDDLFDD